MTTLRQAAELALKEMQNCADELDCHYDDYFEAIKALRQALAEPTTTNNQALRSIYEVWAGSEGIPVPETAVEAYLLRLIEQMRDEASKALAEPEQNLEKDIEDMKQDIEQFQMALREQVELNKNVGTIAYFNGVAEGKRQMRKFGMDCLQKLRETSHIVPMVESPSDEEIVDEVMKNDR